jgi:hypothetical protein
MPWTLSHPAIVLPLRRFSPPPLGFAALVIGSMTPDIGFYIDRFDLSTFAQTLPDSFLACLPTGVILLLFYYLFCRAVCYSSPPLAGRLSCRSARLSHRATTLGDYLALTFARCLDS